MRNVALMAGGGRGEGVMTPSCNANAKGACKGLSLSLSPRVPREWRECESTSPIVIARSLVYPGRLGYLNRYPHSLAYTFLPPRQWRLLKPQQLRWDYPSVRQNPEDFGKEPACFSWQSVHQLRFPPRLVNRAASPVHVPGEQAGNALHSPPA